MTLLATSYLLPKSRLTSEHLCPQHSVDLAVAKTPITGISPPGAPKTIGPYVHIMVHEPTAYSTCIIPLDPATEALVDGTPEDMIRRIYQNLTIVLESAGSSLDRILKQNIYLTVRTGTTLCIAAVLVC